MKGEFSRLVYNRARHYAGLLHQQGRVWLDGDWNEDVLSRLSLLEQTTRDLVGPCAVPVSGQCDNPQGGDSAFRIFPIAGTAANFTIDAPQQPPGRFYVDGILCSIEAPTGYNSQPDYPDAPALPTTGTALVYLEAWRRLITYLEDPEIREIALGGPDTATRLKTVAQVKCVPLTTGTQICADAIGQLPTDGQGTLTTIPPANPQPDDLCRLPDPAVYTGRENHLFRVEIHEPGDLLDAAGTFQARVSGGVSQGATSLALDHPPSPDQRKTIMDRHCLTLSDDRGISELLVVDTVVGTTVTLGQPVSVDYPASNNPTASTAARFKWSRENASFAVAVSNVENVGALRVKLTVTSLGRDVATCLKKGDIVEISDDASELGPARGHLTYVAEDPDPDLLTVQIAHPLPARFIDPPSQSGTGASQDRHLVLRRWDGVGFAEGSFDPVATPDMDLGEGVRIHFGGSDLRSGNYWLFVVRSADGSVEALTDSPPTGIIRHRCPLAVVSIDTSSITILQDCRRLFPPLTGLTELFYAGGDGQEVMPDLTAPPVAGPAGPYWPLGQPLCVRVMNGGCPVAGATMRFKVLSGGGILADGLGVTGVTITVSTDPTGLACCGWQLSSFHDAQSPLAVVQQTEARLLDPDGSDTNQAILFTANLSVAAEVAYDPKSCGILGAAIDVQAAIDRLASIANLVYLGGDGQTAVPDPANPPQLQVLGLPLRVGVIGDCGGVNGISVTFTTSPNGKLSDTAGGSVGDGATKIIPTKTVGTEDGIAECYWRLDPDHQKPSQTVKATIVSTDTPTMKTIVKEIDFTATLLRAQDVVYDPPEGCTNLAGSATVKQALDAVCKIRGGGCEVTVGKGGQYPSLEEAMRALREAEQTSWCICLLPGEYEYIGSLEKYAGPGWRVSISACSRGATLVLKRPLLGKGLASLELVGLQIEAADLFPLVQTTECAEVSIRQTAVQPRDLKNPVKKEAVLVDIGMGAKRVVVEGNTLAAATVLVMESARQIFLGLAPLDRLSGITDPQEFDTAAREVATALAKLKAADRRKLAAAASERLTGMTAELSRAQSQGYAVLLKSMDESRATVESLLAAIRTLLPVLSSPGTALVIRDGGADVTLRSNAIAGTVCLYGLPGPGTLSAEELKLLAGIFKDDKAFSMSPKPGMFEAEGNRLTRLGIAEPMLQSLKDLAKTRKGDLAGVFRSITLSNNVFEDLLSCTVAERLSVMGNHILPPKGDAGLMFAKVAVFVGNIALPPFALQMSCVLSNPPAGDSANLIKVSYV